MTLSLLDYTRQPVGSAAASDEKHTLNYVQAQGICTFHTTPTVVEPDLPGVLIDPDDPNWSGNAVPPESPDTPTTPDTPAPPEEEPYIPA